LVLLAIEKKHSLLLLECCAHETLDGDGLSSTSGTDNN
jgi:hypothetical protein